MAATDGALHHGSITAALAPSIGVNNLNYAFQDGTNGLKDVILDLPPASRTLLIGANGAGKTTLLRLLSGKRLAPTGTVSIAGVDPFSQGLEGVTYLGLEWVLNPVVRTDIDVPTLLSSVGGDVYKERRDELVQILDIDLAWRMHAVSDGERRRVQLAMGLLRPWRILLLDEITVDLDLLSRSNFLDFLKRETEKRACTIVYATHILDNLADWPTHLVHMSMGRVKEWGAMEKFNVQEIGRTGNSQLGQLVLGWLTEDLKERGPRGSHGSEGKTYQAMEGIGGYGNEKSSR
ncbi:MAG: CCR4-NOT regulatory complex component [Thelocarpon impressellum]|nr:MAG: CCR4-NOT regulatory complex component [Thelocarpon impressellum]